MWGHLRGIDEENDPCPLGKSQLLSETARLLGEYMGNCNWAVKHVFNWSAVIEGYTPCNRNLLAQLMRTPHIRLLDSVFGGRKIIFNPISSNIKNCTDLKVKKYVFESMGKQPEEGSCGR